MIGQRPHGSEETGIAQERRPRTVGATARAILEALDERGPLTAAELSLAIGVSISGIRQHANGLERKGLLSHRSLPSDGQGHPTYVYTASDAARRVLRTNDHSLPSILIEGIQRLPAEHQDVYLASATAVIAEEMTGEHAPFADRFRQALAWLSDRAFKPGYADGPVGPVLLSMGRCPWAVVAPENPLPCQIELSALRAALAGADVQPMTWRGSGGSTCVYAISPPSGENAFLPQPQA